VFYTFEGVKRKASSPTTTFRRIAEKPGVFTITAVSDGASGRCQAHKNITKIIHEMPSVRISRGRESIVDIHEGGEAEINFEFGGTPPFEFTYVISFISSMTQLVLTSSLDIHEAPTPAKANQPKSSTSNTTFPTNTKRPSKHPTKEHTK
jgi:hypothetical protein